MSMPGRIFATDEMRRWYPSSIWGDTEYVRADLVAKKDAEIERLRAIILAFVNGVDEYDHNGRQRDEEFRDIFSSLAKTGADYLRERDARPHESGVQSGVQDADGKGKTSA